MLLSTEHYNKHIFDILFISLEFNPMALVVTDVVILTNISHPIFFFLIISVPVFPFL